MKERHNSMRGWFFSALYDAMQEDNRIFFLTGDLGYGALDSIRDDFPERFKNMGASEQVMIGAAVGLALEGFIPFCYSCTSFLIYRPFEWLRNYLHHERIPVKLIGGGLDMDYEKDGFTHYACECRQVLACVPNIVCYWPTTKEEAAALAPELCYNGEPSFIGLRR
jgi:transketolase